MPEAGEILDSVENLQWENESLRRENGRLMNLLTYDKLTGLYKTDDFGRQALLERVQTAEAAGDNIVAAVIDLTNFRGVNNTYDHDTGDEVLKTVATELEELVGLNGLAMRSHTLGDEFCALVVGKEPEEVRAMFEKIRTDGIPWKTAKAEGKISFTLGISSLDELKIDERRTPGEIFQSLLQRASGGEREQHRSTNG